jgi:hypothetical protein
VPSSPGSPPSRSACARKRTQRWLRRGTADLILFNGKITTLDRQNPETQAIAISADRFVAAGAEQDVMRLAGPGTRRVDLKGRRVIPGLPDWSPVRSFGGYQKRADAGQQRKYAFAVAWGCSTACGIHGHAHAPRQPPLGAGSCGAPHRMRNNSAKASQSKQVRARVFC